MADVLIVCVREDEPQAKALAEMFEAAGFSIGGAPSNDAGLRSSGAGVVVWSQASIRSRPFLDAAQRVINAHKAVVASLIEPPPPSSIGDSPAFDLSRWDGDPNDPALDPLFFAVDRMVNSARTAVTGGAGAAEAFDTPPPAPRSAPTPFREPPPSYREPQQSYREPSRSDPLDGEAEHWRAIRDSRDPADFMDYLSRYGPQGTFAEVAELRLKQLSSAGERPAARQPARPATPSRPAAPAALPPRFEPPPSARRAAEPMPRTRSEPPLPQRRAEAAPPPPSRRPPPERGFDRSDELHEPVRREGGAIRALILVILLGGGALIGGLYFGGGLGNTGGQAPQGEDVESVSGPPPVGEPADYAQSTGEADSVPLSQAVQEQSPERAAPSERSRQQQAAANPPPARAQQPASTSVRQPPQTQARQPPTSSPSTPALTPSTTTQAPPSSGPISLTPGSVSGPPQQIQPQPLTTSPASEEPSLEAATPTQTAASRPAPPPPGTVVWLARPSERRIAELYPQRALREGVGGRVVLNCTVLADLSTSCAVVSESPADEGFGRAALSAARAYRSRGTLSNGASAVGSTTRVTFNFRAPPR